jgi:hypothetical protein
VRWKEKKYREMEREEIQNDGKSRNTERWKERKDRESKERKYREMKGEERQRDGKKEGKTERAVTLPCSDREMLAQRYIDA